MHYITPVLKHDVALHLFKHYHDGLDLSLKGKKMEQGIVTFIGELMSRGSRRGGSPKHVYIVTY